VYPTPLRQLAAAALLACAILPAQAQISTGAMSAPRMFHRATPMLDGRIMMTGGASGPGNPVYNSTEIYDPATGQFTVGAPMLTPRRNHAAVRMQDGRILVAGGMSIDGGYTNTAEVYDPVTGQWSAVGPLNTPPADLAGLLLSDGRVMVLDQRSGGREADVFDPSTGLFTKTDKMMARTTDAGLVLLTDGRVLKVGGLSFDNYINGYSNNAELWDPATNQWTPTGQMIEPRSMLQAVVLADGKVMVAGGRKEWTLSSTEIYDPATGTFAPGPPMPMGFEPKSATVLPKGDIILTDNWHRQLMRYEAGTATWNLTGPQRVIARDSAVVLLPDGNVLIAGGSELNNGTAYAAIWEQSCGSQMLDIMTPDQSIPGDGGSASFMVTGAPGCRFETAQVPSWLTVNGPSLQQIPETGSMNLAFSAGANQTGAPRSATFLLANASVTVTQAASASCPTAPVVSPNPFSTGNYGTSSSLNVQAPATCQWSVASMPSFVIPNGATSGTGNGSIAFTVAPNYDPAARSGSGQLVASGQYTTFTFNQDGRPCPTIPTITFSNSTFPAAGGSTTGTVTAAPTCTWKVTTTMTGWTTVTAGGTGTGNGSFTITAAPNTGTARSGGGELNAPGVGTTFNLSQAASPCASWTISPASANIPAGGGNGSLTVAAPAGCTWSLGTVPSWLSLTSANSGSGNGSISYSATANSGAARSAAATLSGAGPTLSVNLSQASTQAPPCSTTISSGTPVSAVLKSSSCPVGARGDNYYIDRYTFSGTGGKVATITMSSATFDTYLYLRDPAGNVIKSDDDGGGGTNSRISFTLPSTGIYTIEATGYGRYSGGAYTLSFIQ